MLFSYVVEHDIGFAPNPFFGICSLAACKPKIREKAHVGDWIVGVGGEGYGARSKLIYAMKVDKIVTFNEYYNDPLYSCKKPNFRGSLKMAQGDNIYYNEEGVWRHDHSRHTHRNSIITQKHLDRDTSIDAVLLSTHFCYFGCSAPDIPDEMREKNGRNIRLDGQTTPHGGLERSANFECPELVSRFEAWLETLNAWGVQDVPWEWSVKKDVKEILEVGTFVDVSVGLG